ncbi:MAG: hypothetical protein GXO37_07960 [Chloroflexi bacterium]|nr:hypothetical protein [Chloroflexota bacterium]
MPDPYSSSGLRDRLNRLIDASGEYLAQRKGLLPLLGLALIVLNGLLGLLAAALGWDDFFFIRQMCLLQIGVVLAVLGILLAWAL